MIASFILFLLGLVVGSFINALQYRIQENKTMKGRSFCPNCKHQLVWYDLVPLFSWIALRGKCRYCKEPISVQYPIVELITGISFMSVGIASGFSQKINNAILYFGDISNRDFIISVISLLLILFITSCAVIISLHDAKTLYVLSKYVYLAILASLLLIFISYSGKWSFANVIGYMTPYLLSAFLATLFFFSLYFFSKGSWMGAGDAEIALLMGLFLGWPRVMGALYIAFISGSLWGLSKVYLFKNAKMKSEIPFGPFLLSGMIVAFIFGAKIIDFYANIYL